MAEPGPPAPTMSYDRVAAVYDETRAWPPEVAEQIGAGLYRLLRAGGPAPPRVVEIGAGTGRVLAPLAARGVWAAGVDVAGAMLARLRARQPPAAPGRLHAVRADAHRLPFAAGVFDAGLLVHVLHLVDDPTAVLVEARRVVRPGGPLVFGVDEQGAGDEDWVGPRWAELVAAAGSTAPASRRETATAEAVAWLAARGAPVQVETLARWTATQTPAAILRRYRERCFSSSWHLADAVLAAALSGMEADLRARYGALDTPLRREQAFRVLIVR